jgi:hypothetical protein
LTRYGAWWPAALTVAACLAVIQPLDAASFALTPGEREAAIAMGKQSVVTEQFGLEWTVNGDAPGQVVTVMTPFYRLALAARNSAFRSEDLRPADVQTLLKAQEGMLTLWVTLSGDRIDFARLYAPVLMRGGQEIKASFTQNERTARREEDGRYTARCLYAFPSDGLKADDRLTLTVKDSSNKAVARFALNLATIR